MANNSEKSSISVLHRQIFQIDTFFFFARMVIFVMFFLKKNIQNSLCTDEKYFQIKSFTEID